MKKNKFFNALFLSLIGFFSFDIVHAEQYTNFKNSVVSCGNGLITDMPDMIPKVLSVVYSILIVLVPVLLVVFSLFDFIKALTAQKDDEIKKTYSLFIKKMINAAFIFFILVVVRAIISLVADSSNVMDCAECLIKNSCSTQTGGLFQHIKEQLNPIINGIHDAKDKVDSVINA